MFPLPLQTRWSVPVNNKIRSFAGCREAEPGLRGQRARAFQSRFPPHRKRQSRHHVIEADVPGAEIDIVPTEIRDSR